jgi:acetoin utilization deacetylase AcuC-like enzyme
MTTLLVTHKAFLEHDTGYGHPEQPDRMRAIADALAAPAFGALKREAAPEADLAAIERLHPKAYIEMVRAAIPSQHHQRLDPAIVSRKLEAACARKAGAAAVDAVVGGEAKNAFCASRPPGHHAEPARAMGFCLFNNVAVAALHARARHGAERVAVVDFDVHHGNGTQAAFWTQKDLFYASTHQMPLFPGTGELGETGVGNIFNMPLKAGDDGDEFRDAFLSRILPGLHNFGPDLIIVSAGFDAHRMDPLAQLRLVEPDFAWVTEKLMDQAEKHCGGKLVSCLEGGYDLDALGLPVATHVETLMGAA